MSTLDQLLPPGINVDEANHELVARIRECLSHALAQTFRDSLERLAGMLRGVPGGRVKLYLDFAPLSLGWCILRADGSAWLAGGLIFHSAHDGYGNGGAPSYSVSLSRESGWSLHS